MTLGSLIQTTGFIRSGKLRALAVSSAERSSILPNVPTIGESGAPGYQTANWWGVAAPRGTPATVVNRLNQEIKAVLQAPDTEKRFNNEGANRDQDAGGARQICCRRNGKVEGVGAHRGHTRRIAPRLCRLQAAIQSTANATP